jgi:hypothetical protein
MVSALFDIEEDGTDRGYDAAFDDVLKLRLRQQPPIGVNTVLFQVYDPAGFDDALGIAANPPRQSKGAPNLTLVGSTSGPAVAPPTVDGEVELTLPADDADFHSWIVRCVVNNGMRTLASGAQVVDPSLIHQRMIVIRSANGVRKIVVTETGEYEVNGWAGAVNEVDGGGGSGNAPALAFNYTFSSSTSGTDPGAGFVRLNRSTGGGGGWQAESSSMMINPVDGDGNDWTDVFDGFAGYIKMESATDWIVFRVTNGFLDGAFFFLDLEPVQVSGGVATSAPFVNGDALTLTMDAGSIPAGSYVGQPSYWDGAAWAPLVIGDPLFLTQLRCPADESLNLGAFGSGGSVNVGAGDFSTYKVGFAAGPNGFIVGVLESGIALQVQASGYDTGGGGVPCIGMFGATPVPRQSITGATTQDQVDSLVAALVAFGLVSDDR